jgi:hypothetical protein
MRVLAQRVVPVLVFLLSACAGSSGPSALGPADRLERGLGALEQGEFEAAVADFLWVAEREGGSRRGREALLLAMAADLDPRNKSRRLDEGAALAARYLAVAPPDDAARPVVLATYLLALELGAPEPSGARAAGLPRPGAPPVSTRILALEREVAKLKGELVRIRKTLDR